MVAPARWRPLRLLAVALAVIGVPGWLTSPAVAPASSRMFPPGRRRKCGRGVGTPAVAADAAAATAGVAITAAAEGAIAGKHAPRTMYV